MGIDELGIDEMGVDEMGSRQSGMTPKALSLFHINRATSLTYDLAGAACRRQIADNFANIQTGPIMS